MVHAYRGQRSTSHVIPQKHPPHFVRQGPSLGPGACSLSSLTIEPQGPPMSTSPSAGISMHYTWLLSFGFGDRVWLSWAPYAEEASLNSVMVLPLPLSAGIKGQCLHSAPSGCFMWVLVRGEATHVLRLMQQALTDWASPQPYSLLTKTQTI